MQDVDIAIGLWAFVGIVGTGYARRVFSKGTARYDRIDAVASSKLLGKPAMAGAYWAFQPVGKLFAFLGISPDAITWTSLGLGAAGGFAFSQGRFGLGTGLSMAGMICDAIDGMVARAMGVASDAGEVLDAAIDRASDFMFLAGVAYFYRDTPPIYWMTMLALLGAFLVSYATAKAEALRIEVPGGAMRRPERSTYLLIGTGLNPISMTFVEPHLLPHGMHPIGIPMAVVVTIVATVSNVSAVRRFGAMMASIRARDALRRAHAAEVAAHVDGAVVAMRGERGAHDPLDESGENLSVDAPTAEVAE